mmetsp:Transcript_59403/g.128447  ORF Transcript_59403/g.128447 Transcript_59403/m.128447 type:complete len:289 (+) Transcript_59403:79-945(+)
MPITTQPDANAQGASGPRHPPFSSCFPDGFEADSWLSSVQISCTQSKRPTTAPRTPNRMHPMQSPTIEVTSETAWTTAATRDPFRLLGRGVSIHRNFKASAAFGLLSGSLARHSTMKSLHGRVAKYGILHGLSPTPIVAQVSSSLLKGRALERRTMAVTPTAQTSTRVPYSPAQTSGAQNAGVPTRSESNWPWSSLAAVPKSAKATRHSGSPMSGLSDRKFSPLTSRCTMSKLCTCAIAAIICRVRWASCASGMRPRALLCTVSPSIRSPPVNMSTTMLTYCASRNTS